MRPRERIPQHAHSGPNDGGPVSGSTVITLATSSGGGSASTTAADVSVLDTAANFTGTDVEAVLAELQDNIDAVGGILSNYAATTDPAVTDDSGDGYAIGSRWINTSTDEEFVATDVTVGAALWVSTTDQGAGSGDTSGQFVAIFDGGGAAPTAGATADVVAPFTGTLTDWEMLGDVSGSAVVKVAKDVAANHPPTFPTDLITASAPPTLTGAARAASSSLTGWTTAVTAGDVLRFYLDSASTLGRVTCVLNYSRP